MKRDGGKTTTFRLLQTDGLNIPPREKNSLRVLRDRVFLHRYVFSLLDLLVTFVLLPGPRSSSVKSKKFAGFLLLCLFVFCFVLRPAHCVA